MYKVRIAIHMITFIDLYVIFTGFYVIFTVFHVIFTGLYVTYIQEVHLQVLRYYHPNIHSMLETR